jgi:hypothetical protein
MRVSILLLLLKVGDSHILLSMAQGRSVLSRYERFASRQDRLRYILHVSTANLYCSQQHLEIIVAQAVCRGGDHCCRQDTNAAPRLANPGIGCHTIPAGSVQRAISVPERPTQTFCRTTSEAQRALPLALPG